MEYINDLIRRKDRLLSEDEAMSLLENGEYGVLSISSTEEGVYGIPINYVWDKQQSIYFHCAPQNNSHPCHDFSFFSIICYLDFLFILSSFSTTPVWENPDKVLMRQEWRQHCCFSM
jgi:hypothetical protein